MSVTVNRQAFNNALRALRTIVKTNPTLPILNNVYLEAKDGYLTITANSLEMQARRTIEAGGELLTTAPAKLLSDFSGSMAGATIELKVDGNKLRISSGNQKASLPIIDADQFPTGFLSDVANASFTLSSEQLLRAASRTTPFASGDFSRPVLTGVSVSSTGDGLIHFAAADNYRLATAMEEAQSTAFTAILPAVGLAVLGKLLEGDSIKVAIGSRGAYFSSDNTEVAMRLVEGTFPNIEQLFSKEFVATLLVNQDELSSAMRLAAISSEVSVKFVVAPDGLRIHSAGGANDSEFDTTIPVTVGGSEEVQIALNPQFFASLVAVFEGSTNVEIGFNGKESPINFRDPAADDFRCVMMPVRTT